MRPAEAMLAGRSSCAGDQSREGRENTPAGGTSHVRGEERIYLCVPARAKSATQPHALYITMLRSGRIRDSKSHIHALMHQKASSRRNRRSPRHPAGKMMLGGGASSLVWSVLAKNAPYISMMVRIFAAPHARLS
eukprot:9471430-Pyramimonas_sp.AAC.1